MGDYGRKRMLRRSTSTRTAAAVLAAGLGLALVTVAAPAASAAPDTGSSAASPAVSSALKASGPYAAAADASLVTLDVPSLSPAILPKTNVDLARSLAVAQSDNDVDADKPGAQRTGASASTTGFGTFGTHVLGANLDLQTNEASAPASEANENVLLPLDLSPLLDVPVIRTTALANWSSDTECVSADKPLSESDQALADLTLLGVTPDSSVLDLNTNPDDGAVDTKAYTQLTSIPGANDPRAVTAHIETDVTTADLLNNLAPDVDHLLHVEAVNSPAFTVKATGLPGGATVEGDRPTVKVTLAGNTLITLDDTHQTEDALITDLVLGDLIHADLNDLLTDLHLEALIPVVAPITDAVNQVLAAAQPIVRLSIPFEKSTAADGTSASVQGSLLRVEVLLPEAVTGGLAPVRTVVNQILKAIGANIDGPLLSLDLAPYGASVKAPAGGLQCGEPQNPLRELNKHASAAEVAPGSTFEYDITVPNRGPCALTGVTVTDTVSGPSGFEIVDTEPDATVQGNKITWNVGNLAVNQTKSLTITVKVPSTAKNGEDFDDHVTATGNCEGRTVTKDKDVKDIPKVKTDFTGPCNVQFSNKDASHIQVTKGETFAYFVHAFNSGGTDCKNVTVTDTIDGRLTFVSCNKDCTNAGDKVTWKVPTIPGGGSVVLSVVVKVKDDATGTLANSAIITPENGPPATVSTKGPVIGPDSIPKDPTPASRHPLPKTGGVIPTGLAALLAAGALALLHVRRKASIA
jgi:uncharacterized repeat protein (TIGR01451 family)